MHLAYKNFKVKTVINSNKGYFWMPAEDVSGAPKAINSNKGCFWIEFLFT